MLILLCPVTFTPRSKPITTSISTSLLQRQGHGLAGCRRGACGIKNLSHDEVGSERCQAVGFRAIENYGAEFRERIVVRRGYIGGLERLLFFARTPHAQVIARHRDDV